MMDDALTEEQEFLLDRLEQFPLWTKEYQSSLEVFVTSIDAIAGLIEARGLYWELSRYEVWATATVGDGGKFYRLSHEISATALCSAFVTWLEEKTQELVKIAGGE